MLFEVNLIFYKGTFFIYVTVQWDSLDVDNVKYDVDMM